MSLDAKNKNGCKVNALNDPLPKEEHEQKTLARSQILGVGTYLPSQRVTSEDMMRDIGTEKRYGLAHNWMSVAMGIHERRMVADHQRPSDLAITAAQRALDSCPEVNPDGINAVIFCGIERDRPEPATAHSIQKALGLRADHVFDVANACLGFFEGLKIASTLVESGMAKYALVVTGEVTSRVSCQVADQLKRGVSTDAARYLWGALSVGDAGGAILVGRSHTGNSGFIKFRQHSESKHVNLCHYEWTSDGSVSVHMNMAPLLVRGIKLHKEIYRETLRELNWQKGDWTLTHQTGDTAYEHTANVDGIERETLIKTYPKLGNVTTATLPVSFQTLMENNRVKAGDRVGGLFAGSGLAVGQFGYII